jgi:timeless protein
MLGVTELRHLFLLLIRYFKPGVQSKQYLQDLVITNHVFLLLLEKISSNVGYGGDFKMFEFVREFSSPLIMQQYGHLLEDFKNNGEFVNDCVFTMMVRLVGNGMKRIGGCNPIWEEAFILHFIFTWYSTM